MTDVPNPGPTPLTFDWGALFAKAQRYVQEMAERPSDDWQHVLWSGLALELLARAALAKFGPVLLADMADKNWNHLLYAMGYSPLESKYSPRSIATSEVLRRLREIAPDFDKELHDFCILHTGMRNAELHSGEMPFANVDASQWHPNFYRACKVLTAIMGVELKDFLGEGGAELAEKLIAAASDQTAKAVPGEVAAYQKVWGNNSEAERKKSAQIAAVWAVKHEGHRVNCPACGCTALVFGEPASAPIKTIKDDQITERQEYLPSRFECVACGLKINGLSKLAVVKLSGRYQNKSVYDASEYYATESEYEGYEDDNNDPY